MSSFIKDFFNQKAESWDSHIQNDHAMITAILKLTGLKPKQKVLDVGCGTGVLVPHILKYTPADYHAIDLSEKMIERAKHKAAGLPVQFHCMDILELTEKDFDFAIVFNAYPHFPEPAKLAAKLCQSLASGGRFVIAHDHSRHTINSRHHAQAVQPLSRILQPVAIEAQAFAPYFKLDILADSPDCYVLSGVVDKI